MISNETILYNARLILPDKIIKGSLSIKDGKIHSMDEDSSKFNAGIDCVGDFLLPGLIELHTDNLEKYIVPRPGIYWPSYAASIIAHDNQVVGSGITTVLDAIAIGFNHAKESRSHILDLSVNAVNYAQAKSLLRADHFLHLRCEIPGNDLFPALDNYAGDKRLKLLSVMDHTPGQRQWRDLSKWRTFHSAKNWTDNDAQEIIEKLSKMREENSEQNRQRILAIAKKRNIPVASHDDTTAEHSLDSSHQGISISEFPTTIEAAQKAKELGLRTIMGAPNIVRGESHSGNISASLLAEHNLLDGLSSDYMPISLLHGAFEINRRLDIPLYKSVRMVTANVADMLRFQDRGKLSINRNADVIRVKVIDDFPHVRTVFKNGHCVFSSGLF